jgi:uncharacterized delta-60 repeat protein
MHPSPEDLHMDNRDNGRERFEALEQWTEQLKQHIRMVARRLQAAVWRGTGVGVLAGLLLLPLSVGAVEAGDLDISFGGDGTVLTDFGGGSTKATALALQHNSKIVVAGSSTANGTSKFALARYLPNGTLDATFGGNGTILSDFGSDRVSEANALAIQTDGKIVVAGVSFSNISRHDDFTLARYLPNGTLDTTFGSQGLVLTDFGGGSAVAYALVLQSDGKIVVAGVSSSTAPGNGDFALARYLANGTLDATFNSDGKVTTDWGDNDQATALAIQRNGKIVVAGSPYHEESGPIAFALARYRSK